MGPLTTDPLLLAQDGAAEDAGMGEEFELPPDVLPGQGTTRSVTEQIAEAMPNDFLASVVTAALGPVLQILLIVVIASLVLRFARRVIQRAVLRAKDPDSGPGVRRRRRQEEEQEPPGYAMRRAQRADALGALLTSVATVVVWVLAAFLVLAEIGVNLAPLVAGAGVVGLAVGFGAQDLVSDFLSGVFMLAEDQFGVGDIVDVGEASGVVEGVTLRTTKIRDVEGTLWHVPNGEIRRVGNSSQQWARSLLDIAVAYDTDIDSAIEIIGAVAVAMSEEEGYEEKFLDAPDVWGVQALGADSVDIRLVIKTQPGTQWAISRELRRRIKGAFDEVGIEIPFAQRTTWIRQEPDHRPPGVLEPGAIDRAVAASRSGDPGAQKVLAQDENAVAADVEEELAGEDDLPVGDEGPR